MKGTNKLLIFIFVALITVSNSFAAIPRLINYQGKISDKNGTSLNGSYGIQLRIYDAESGGTLLWAENQASILIQNGIFNVQLGAVTPLALPFDKAYYLETQVGTETLSPRQAIASSGYSVSNENIIPHGVILMWSGALAAIPAGWALCDGKWYDPYDLAIGQLGQPGSDLQHTVQTPNLMDKFIVGAGSTYNPTATGGSAAHTHSLDLSHTHTYSGSTSGGNSNRGHADGNAGDGAGMFSLWDHVHSFSGTTSDSSIASKTSSSSSNLPPFFSLAYIMKL
jgi:hypothetical protein